MKKIYILLFSIFVFNINLFALDISSCPPSSGNYWDISSVSTVKGCSAIPPSDFFSCDSPYTVTTFVNSNVIVNDPVCTDSYRTGSGNSYTTTIIKYKNGVGSSCVPPNYINSNYMCVAPAAPTCLDNQYLDANNTCQDISTPADFPQDANASHGGYSNGYAPIPQADCNSQSSPDYTTSLGRYHIVGWDYGAGKCLAFAFKCNSGFIYDSVGNTCVMPPETKDIPPNSNTNDSANQCSGSKWGQTWTYNFCDQCQGNVGIWLPPVGLEGYGLQCNKKYVEYQCTTDYRLKKFTEVSCGNIIPKDKTTKQIDLNNLDTPLIKDTNTSSLPARDNTLAITSQISKQIELQKALNDKVSTADGQNKLLDGINKLGDKLDSMNNGKLSQDGVKKGVKDALDARDNNLSVPSDANETGPGGNGLADAKNAIIGQYGVRFDLFGVTSCGQPSFSSSITFMSMTVENPLPVMDNSLKSYYPIFKNFFLLVATFLGLLSVFRR
jgi:hypothetical protein